MQRLRRRKFRVCSPENGAAINSPAGVWHKAPVIPVQHPTMVGFFAASSKSLRSLLAALCMHICCSDAILCCNDSILHHICSKQPIRMCLSKSAAAATSVTALILKNLPELGQGIQEVRHPVHLLQCQHIWRLPLDFRQQPRKTAVPRQHLGRHVRVVFRGIPVQLQSNRRTIPTQSQLPRPCHKDITIEAPIECMHCVCH